MVTTEMTMLMTEQSNLGFLILNLIALRRGDVLDPAVGVGLRLCLGRGGRRRGLKAGGQWLRTRGEVHVRSGGGGTRLARTRRGKAHLRTMHGMEAHRGWFDRREGRELRKMRIAPRVWGSGSCRSAAFPRAPPGLCQQRSVDRPARTHHLRRELSLKQRQRLRANLGG